VARQGIAKNWCNQNWNKQIHVIALMAEQQRTGLSHNNYGTTQSPQPFVATSGYNASPSTPLLPQPMPIDNPSKVNYTLTRK